MYNLYDNAQIHSYKGFEQRNFFLHGHLTSVVVPKAPSPDKRWIWRAEFLGAFDTVDIAMLEQGFYLVYYSISDMYGCPQAVELMRSFYDFLTGELDFAEKTILFGFSRGGLYSVNFAARYPELILALYLDAPVIDIASWPGGTGKGSGSPKEYEECLRLYGLDETTVGQYTKGLPDKFEVLTTHSIPLVIVAGDSDEPVPYMENCQLLVDYYNKKGGKLLYILKKGCGHHPHSLEDPLPVVKFLLSCI